MSLSPELRAHLEEVAQAPVLLVATDYDGTLAPIVENPDEAFPRPEALVALKALSAMPQTEVAIISGRAIRDLMKFTNSPEGIHLIGSHGSEFDPDFAETLPETTKNLRDRVLHDLNEIAKRDEGLVVEEKPTGGAFHYRLAEDSVASAALQEVLEGPGSLDGVHIKEGKKVCELSVVDQNKGSALRTMRQRFGATSVVFLGDDKTDEDVFSILCGPDLGVKVGRGETKAQHRVQGVEDVWHLFAYLAEKRVQWLAGSKAERIEEHSLLSDQRTTALVTKDARIVWLCVPRVDSPALFSELVGGPCAGRFSIEPESGKKPVHQRYLDDSLILETRWPDFTIKDYLDCSMGRPSQRSGRTDLVRVIEGRGRVRITFAPRLDFGRLSTRLLAREGGLEIQGAVDPIVLHSPGIHWSIEQEGTHHTAEAIVDLGPHPLILQLRYGTGSLKSSTLQESERRKKTEKYWKQWVSDLSIPSVASDLVKRSALTLKALCYGPTGGILAAATTSLPETIGGVRNWDYRYTWLRDAALTAEALARLGSIHEGMRFLDWVLGVIENAPSPERLRPLYTVTGNHLGPEAEIAHLHGYCGSRPVRIGNAAAAQVQLDVFGPIINLVYVLLMSGAPLSTEHWRIVESFAIAVEHRWQEPDHGIWEVRSNSRHHIHSKVMCWLAIDRAIKIAEHFLDQDRQDWHRLRDKIRKDVLENGFNENVQAFTAAYDCEDLDAAALQVGLYGLVEPNDPRLVSTVDAIERELREGVAVWRYRYEDGLPGKEGGFLFCTSWLIDALLLIGREDQAWQLFEEFCGLFGPTGLLSEEYDPETGLCLGNHPQAFTHLGLIHNALNLAGAKSAHLEEHRKKAGALTPER